MIELLLNKYIIFSQQIDTSDESILACWSYSNDQTLQIFNNFIVTYHKKFPELKNVMILQILIIIILVVINKLIDL